MDPQKEDPVSGLHQRHGRTDDRIPEHDRYGVPQLLKKENAFGCLPAVCGRGNGASGKK
jgi:hypothetical protein